MYISIHIFINILAHPYFVLVTVIKYNIAESTSAQHIQFHDSPFFNHIDLIKTSYFLKLGFSACLPK